MKHEICSKLELSIWHDGSYVRVRLEDPLELTEAEVSVELDSTTLASRAYHVREAIVIGVRQLVAQAFEVGMMNVDVTKLPYAPERYKIAVKRLPEPLEEDVL
jgi:hypothetical protein